MRDERDNGARGDAEGAGGKGVATKSTKNTKKVKDKGKQTDWFAPVALTRGGGGGESKIDKKDRDLENERSNE